jgi:hypothetical protein
MALPTSRGSILEFGIVTAEKRMALKPVAGSPPTSGMTKLSVQRNTQKSTHWKMEKYEIIYN